VNWLLFLNLFVLHSNKEINYKRENGEKEKRKKKCY